MVNYFVSLACQVAPVPNPETADVEEARSSEPGSTTDTSAKNTAISETDVESAESVAVSDEPIISVITEEASVTLTDLSAVQAPAETHTGITDIDLCLLVSVSLSPRFKHQSHESFY